MRPCAAFYRIQPVTGVALGIPQRPRLAGRCPSNTFTRPITRSSVCSTRFTSLFFLLVGFSLILIIRWQLAYPGEPVPLIGALLGEANAPGGIMLPEFYNQLGAMHGTIMVFLAVVPLAVGAFGNYLVPLQIGAPDMAFPRLNIASYWLYFAGGVVMLASFFVPGGAANSDGRRIRRSPTSRPAGQTWWLVGMLLLIFSSLLGAINIITTIVQLRAPGMTWFRLPFFVWAQFVTAFLLLLAFPALQAAAVLQGMDRIAGTSFFLPSGLVVSGQPLERRRRRQPAALAAPVLVSRAPRGLRAHPAGDGHRRGGHHEQHAEAALGLPPDGVLGLRPRLPVVRRVGAPHVPHRHGHRRSAPSSRRRR